MSLRGLRDAVLAGEPGCVCDPELFTGPAGIEPEDEPPEDRAARIEVARQVCAACPVRRPCLAYALRTRPAAGVWAGFTPEEITGLIAAAARPARCRGSPPPCARWPAEARRMRGWRHDRAGQPPVGVRRVRGGVHRRDVARAAVPGLRARCPRRPGPPPRCGGARPRGRASRAARPRELWVLEADTPVGVICLTLCGPCADAERTPRLSCPAAVGRAMAHEQHAGAGVAW